MTAVPSFLNTEIESLGVEVRAEVGLESLFDADSWLSSRFAVSNSGHSLI